MVARPDHLAHVVALRQLHGKPTATERLDSMHRGLAALRRHRHKLGAEALAQQFAGLQREAAQLAHELADQDLGGPPDAG